jgi:trehalose 6-phosphate phosphatase
MKSETTPRGGATDSKARAPIAAFLDFDGTLVELADRPESVVLPEQLAENLAGLAKRLGGALALVTGRPIDVVDGFLAPYRFAVAGGHGTERRRADGTMLALDPALVAASARIGAQLTSLAQREPRLALEIKSAAVALHFRQAPELAEICRTAMDEALHNQPLFAVITGKMVLEARPAGVDKGRAVEAFMAEAPFAGRVPLFIGDDRTDEDGFAIAQARGGLGIKIGPGDTVARLRLASPAAVYRLLEALGDGGPLADIAGVSNFVAYAEALQ